MISKDEETRGILLKTTLIDFPGRVACAFFLPGCNLRCPYCYNRELALGIIPEENSVSTAGLYGYLKKRRNLLSGLVLSGGEALLNPRLPEIIENAKSLGYKIKLDTNGTLPEKLEKIIRGKSTRPDFIAMDIKTSPSKYAEKLAFHGQKKTEAKKKAEADFQEKILKSVRLVSEFPPQNREFRTVLVPTLVEKKDIEEISSILPPDATWKFSQFANENCLSPEFNRIAPFSQTQAEALVEAARNKIPGASLR